MNIGDWSVWARVVVWALGLAATGCAIGSSSQSPQSHFAFPNSNVIPLGQAQGKVSKLCGILIVQWDFPNADMQEQATQQALQKANADSLINVRTDSDTFNAFLFSMCSVSVRGTAARMEVGRQVLLPLNPAAAPPPGAAAPAPPAAAPPPPPPVAPPAPPPAAAARGGCTSNADCKGPRTCVSGACVSP